MAKKLTDSFIKGLKNRNPAQAAVAQSFADGDGLSLLAHNDSYGWRYRYRFGGKAKMLSLGTYPEVSLKDAREKLADLRKTLASGTDPSVARKNEKRDLTDDFKSVALRWHDAWSVGKNEDHKKRVLNRLELNIFPEIGSLPIKSITPQDLIRISKKVIEKRGAHDVAKRCFSNCSQVFRWAIVEGICEINPAAQISLADAHIKAPPVKNQARLDEDAMPELLRAIDTYKEVHGGSAITQIALKLMSYTFLRTSELIGARWDEVDLKKNQIVIPASRMKQISRTAQDHIVPLAKQAKAALEELRLYTGKSDFLFPHESNPKKHMSNNTILFAMYRMGFQGRMTGHGFRGFASTVLNERGYPRPHIEAQLSHLERDKVSGAYNHAQYLEGRRKMMADYADILDALKKKKKASK